MSNNFTFDDILLVPQKSIVNSRDEVDVSTKLGDISLDIPILSANMDTVTEESMALAMSKEGGLGVIHRFMTIEDQVYIVKKVKYIEGYKVAASVGVSIEDVDRTLKLLDAGADFIVVDIAHAHSISMENFCKNKTIADLLNDDHFKYKFIVGNIATREAAVFLYNLGVRIMKIGIGPGSTCITRKVTGHGVPQLTAIQNCTSIRSKLGFVDGLGWSAAEKVYFIADGGIRSSGDIVKALAFGADTVMLGNMLAGTIEASGETVVVNGNRYKKIRGMASESASEKRRSFSGKNGPSNFVEGIEGFVKEKGFVKDVLSSLVSGIKSGISYGGAKDISGLRKEFDYIEVSSATRVESGHHDVDIVK